MFATVVFLFANVSIVCSCAELLISKSIHCLCSLPLAEGWLQGTLHWKFLRSCGISAGPQLSYTRTWRTLRTTRISCSRTTRSEVISRRPLREWRLQVGHPRVVLALRSLAMAVAKSLLSLNVMQKTHNKAGSLKSAFINTSARLRSSSLGPC